MAFNKFFVILLLGSCALAMPIQDTKPLIDVGSTSEIKIDDSVAVVKPEVEEKSEETDVTDSSINPEALEVLKNRDVIKRSVDGESSDAVDDLETAAGTNLLRPLFVYRQQVAYRQRVRNENRRGSRRF